MILGVLRNSDLTCPGSGCSAIVRKGANQLESFEEVMLVMDLVTYMKLDARHGVGEVAIWRCNRPDKTSQIATVGHGAHTNDGTISP